MEKVRIFGVAGILLLMGYVALWPNVGYAPVPRAMLFLLASFAVAAFLGGEAQARLKMKLPGFLFVAGGSAAVAFAALFFLTSYFKPEYQIAAYSVFDESGKEVDLDWEGALTLLPNASGVAATPFVRANTFVLIFPEQVTEQLIRLKKTSDGKTYTGALRYAGTRRAILNLGQDLQPNN
jgi:hypothetical protein